MIEDLQLAIHDENVRAGWWSDPVTGEELRGDRRFATAGWKMLLIHSEISEACEGLRKDLMDDKLPHRPMVEVELADAIIRILDLAGALNLDVSGAIEEKRKFNASRLDHKIENRNAVGGKKA